jgi:hypothetical protein
MDLLGTLEKRFRRYAIPNLTAYLVAGQAAAVVIHMVQPAWTELLFLVPEKVAAGEYWRLLSFLFAPPAMHPIFAFFALYLLYLMGTALEANWGAFRYNTYVFIAWLATLVSASFAPAQATGNTFIDTSVFLAFAMLYPNFTLSILFILPVKIKWLALITWLYYGYVMILPPPDQEWSARLSVVASVANFLLFFWRDIYSRLRHGHRRMRWQSRVLEHRDKPFHVCAKCGITDKTDRFMDFRYCNDCVPALGYCTAHIRDHEHKVEKAPAEAEAGKS